MNKTLLIVGNGDHQFIFNYVKWLKKKGNFSKIDILTDRKVSSKHQHIYHNIFSIHKNSKLFNLLTRIKGVRRFFRLYLYKRLINKLPEYTNVHIHFLSKDNIFIANQFKSTNKILSIWGSDYYRSNVKDKAKIKDACINANKVTFTNELTRVDFENDFNWTKDNLRICRFGLAPLEILETLKENRIESKKILQWDTKKTAVTIGYNLSKNQQHLEILKQISSLKDYSSKVELILPITYGGDRTYKQEILSLLKQLNFTYKYYDKFLDDLTVSHIRNASDIMVQLQTTDQFSGSMQEHLYTRNIVITGSWLPYQTMKDNGINFIEVDKISDLRNSISNVIKNYDEYFSKTAANPDAVLKLCSWEKNIAKWLELYN